MASPNEKVSDASIAELSEGLGILESTARCLANRGITSIAEGERFLEPRLQHLRPPEGLADLPKAVDRLATAINEKQPIGCFGDYDVDGVTTCALLTGFLRRQGATVFPRVATRQLGYGFGLEHAKALLESGAKLIVTGDCGTSDLEAIAYCNEQGVDVIVIDHHTVPDENSTKTHPSYALVNPFRQDSQFPFQGMASVGLSFYVIAALRTKLDAPKQDLFAEIDLVALGTVADLVPLSEENRTLTTFGLKRLNEAPRPGIQALLKLANSAKKNADSSNEPITERVIGWKIGPRLNAPGRLGDAKPALELLLAKKHEDAAHWAAIVETANLERRAVQDKVFAEVEQQLDAHENDACVVLAGEGWPSGVVGIVASRVAERTGRPSILIGVDKDTGEGRGSGRTAGKVNLYQLLSEADEYLERFGGHAAAAGLTVKKQNIEALRDRLVEAAERLPKNESDANTSEIGVDVVVELAQVNERFTAEVLALAPFGKGNEEPVFACKAVRVSSSRRVGDGSHLKLEVEADGTVRGGIGFGLGEDDPGADALVDLTFAPMINHFRGRSTVELGVRSVRPAEPTA